MSTATVAAPSEPRSLGKTHFLLRRLHSLTGILFGLYLCVHLFVNATIAQGVQPGGTSIYQLQVDQIHRLPLLPVIEWTAIYLPLLYHTVYGIYIALTGQPNVGSYHYGKNWAYLFQRISAAFIVIFVLFHVLSFKYGLFGSGYAFEAHGGAMRTVAQHFDQSFFVTWVLYPLGILAATFHLANGFWTAGITWGLTVSKAAQKRWGMVCFGLFVATFLAGMTALVAGAAMQPHEAPAAVVTH